MIDGTLHPRLQSKLLGHQETLAFVKKQFQEQKLHPALLISGPKGIGKATFSYALARQILAGDQNFHHRLIDNNSHPNLLAVELGVNDEEKPQKEITVNDIRKVIEFCRQSPALPGWRVIIIDAVDEINRNGSNALLKVLEEPPLKTQFILVCHVYGRLLPTLRSRCLKILLRSLDEQGLELSRSPLAAELARGSYGRYLYFQHHHIESLLDQTLTLVSQAFNNQIASIQTILKTFDKMDARFTLIPELLQWVVHRLILLQHQMVLIPLEQDQKILHLGKVRDIKHWLNGQHACQKFLDLTHGTHLDPSHVLMALLMILVKPTLADEFIYDC
jgi:DNA polymerase-3 subunit delta'